MSLADEMRNFMADFYGIRLSAKELEEAHSNEKELEENVYVAQGEEDNIIGYVSFSRSENEWAGPHYEVEHIVVAEKYSELNVGRMLFNVVLEKAKKEKVNITTSTIAGNEAALKFYEELGFKPLTVGLLLDLQKRIIQK